MSATWWIALGAAAVGGAVGGGAVLLLGGSNEAPPAVARAAEREPEGEPRATDDEEDGERGSSDLVAQVRSLERRVSLLTAALGARGNAGDQAEDPSEAGALGEVDVADPVFEAAVLDIMERERSRTDEERSARRKERDAERNTRIVSDLGSRLGLRPDQNERLGALIGEQFDKVRALRDDDSESRPVTRRQWRERMDAIAADTDARLAELFTPAQLAAYRALDPDDQLNLGGGRRGGGRSTPEAAAAPPAP